MKNIIDLVNPYIAKLDKVTLIKEFNLIHNQIVGKFEVDTKKGILEFDAEIPIGFPLGGVQFCIRFYCKNTEGYPHVNLDNSICIHSHPSTDATERLKLEFDLLFEWIQKYYIEEQLDEKYQYLLLPQLSGKPQTHLLFNNINKEFFKNDCGNFEFSPIGSHQIVIQKIDKVELDWSKNIKGFYRFVGTWIFIGDEPVIERRKVITNWVDFQKYLSRENTEKLIAANNKQNTAKDKNKLVIEPLIIGYWIGNNSNKEIHWELIECPLLENFPIKSHYEKGKNKKVHVFKNQPINWQKSSNISYERFFGRGRLSEKIVEKKILIIGTGAIGSNLSLIFAKGGVKQITLCDFDSVESGNLCRANFGLDDIGSHKLYASRIHLLQASPYITIDLKVEISKVMPYSSNFESIKDLIEKFDIIFDCSTDNELAYMFDLMKPKCQIINLSITNKANTLICAVNENITETKYALVNSEEHQAAELWIGTGCQYPTFEASNLDIQTLLNYTIKNIQRQLDYDNKLRDFVIKNSTNDYKAEMKLYIINEFEEPVSKLKLKVTDEILHKIEKYSGQFYPKEIGGIFIGLYGSDDKTIFIKDIIVSNKIDSSPNHFTRYSNDLNAKLKELHEKSDGELVYVGEWHSHPNGSTEYSHKDFKAMESIGKDANSQNQNPILLIHGFDRFKSDFQFYLYKKNNLVKYVNNNLDA